jgi:hypothetical protein
LIKRPLSFVIRSECKNSGDPIEIAIDSDLRYRVADEQIGVRVFVPMVDVITLDEPSIIDSF